MSCFKIAIPFRGENISSHARKIGSWCLLGVLFLISDEQPRPFYTGVLPEFAAFLICLATALFRPRRQNDAAAQMSYNTFQKIFSVKRLDNI